MLALLMNYVLIINVILIVKFIYFYSVDKFV